MKYTINELANSKGVSQPVREALLQMEAELDATNRQVEILSDALAESRREVAALKAVQEPVAWANPNDLKNFDMKVRTNGGPLHTLPLCLCTPPTSQRQWVGLTDEEIKLQWSVFWEAECHPWAIDFARAIESKLKEKNHA